MYTYSIFWTLLRLTLLLTFVTVVSCDANSKQQLSDKALYKYAVKAQNQKDRNIYLIKILSKLRNHKVNSKNFEFNIYQSMAHGELMRLKYKIYRPLFLKLIKHNSPALRNLAIDKLRSAKDINTSAILIHIMNNDKVPKLQLKAINAIINLEINLSSKTIITKLKTTSSNQIRQQLLTLLINSHATDSCQYIHSKVTPRAILSNNNYLYLKTYVSLRCTHAENILSQYISNNLIDKQSPQLKIAIISLAISLNSPLITDKLLLRFKKTGNIGVLNALLWMKNDSALIFLNGKLDGILESPRYLKADKTKLISNILRLDNKKWITISLNSVLSIKDTNLRKSLISEFNEMMNADNMGGSLYKNIKHKRYIIDKLITNYSKEHKKIRMTIANTPYSFHEYSRKRVLKKIMIHEPNTKIQCRLLTPYLRLANRSDIKFVAKFKHIKYGNFCRVLAKEFMAKYYVKKQ